MKARLIICMMALLVVIGCITATDPVTGEKLYSLDPNAVEAVEGYVETGITLGGVAGAVFPVILPFVTAAIGIYATWKKIRPQVVKAQNRATLLHTGVASLVIAVEELKKVSPESWEKLKDEIKVGPEIENIIRAIRGLPAKT